MSDTIERTVPCRTQCLWLLYWIQAICSTTRYHSCEKVCNIYVYVFAVVMFVMPLTATMVTNAVKVSHIDTMGQWQEPLKSTLMPHFLIDWRSTHVNNALLLLAQFFIQSCTRRTIVYRHRAAGASKIHFGASFPNQSKINACHSTLLANTVLYSITHEKKSANMMSMGV